MELKSPFIRSRGIQQGMSLLETMVALAILLIITVGILSLALVATSTTENQGHLAARTAEYAQDKMEQLISLAFCDLQTDTTVFPAASSGGTGLEVSSSETCATNGSGNLVSSGGTAGSSDPNSPVSGYVDYLDKSGNPLGGGSTAPASWFYIRVWQISTLSSSLKQITVTTKVRSDVGGEAGPSGTGALPQSTVITLKSSPF